MGCFGRMRMNAGACQCSNFFWVLWLLSGLLAAEGQDPAKQPIDPTQGSISPSGKFLANPQPGSSNATPILTPTEAKGALLKALRVEQTGSNTFRIGRVEFDKLARTVTLPAQVAIRNQVVEYALVTEQGKAYESIFTTEAQPAEVHLAMLLLGGNLGPISGEFDSAQVVSPTNAVQIEVSWRTGGRSTNLPLSQLVALRELDPTQPVRPMGIENWLYNGSLFDHWGFVAQREGSLIALIRDASALVNNPSRDRDNDQIHWPVAGLLPDADTAVQVTLRLPKPRTTPPGTVSPGLTPITPMSSNHSDKPQIPPPTGKNR
jgi:hypothetical protein